MLLWLLRLVLLGCLVMLMLGVRQRLHRPTVCRPLDNNNPVVMVTTVSRWPGAKTGISGISPVRGSILSSIIPVPLTFTVG